LAPPPHSRFFPSPLPCLHALHSFTSHPTPHTPHPSPTLPPKHSLQNKTLPLQQDGTIEYQIKLTGELSTNMLSPGEDAGHPESGTLVAPGVNAQHHQHMFAVRIDPAIDDAEGGKGVVVSEARAALLPLVFSTQTATKPF